MDEREVLGWTVIRRLVLKAIVMEMKGNPMEIYSNVNGRRANWYLNVKLSVYRIGIDNVDDFVGFRFCSRTRWGYLIENLVPILYEMMMMNCN